MGNQWSGFELKQPSGGATRASPTVPSTREEARTLGKRQLAAVFRIFARHGLSYGPGGHITYRDPILTDHFWINPVGVDFGMIRVSDLVLVRDDGVIVEGSRSINAAGYAIHSTIHKMRPDVNAVAHSHSRFGTTFSALARHLPPISQEACSFYKDHGLYQTYGGAADLSEGEAIGAALGDHKAVVCANHGLFTAGATVGAAAFWFLRFERACEQFLMASAAGAPVVIDDATARLAASQVGSAEVGRIGCLAQIDRMLAEEPDLCH